MAYVHFDEIWRKRKQKAILFTSCIINLTKYKIILPAPVLGGTWANILLFLFSFPTKQRNESQRISSFSKKCQSVSFRLLVYSVMLCYFYEVRKRSVLETNVNKFYSNKNGKFTERFHGTRTKWLPGLYLKLIRFVGNVTFSFVVGKDVLFSIECLI